MSCNQNLKGPIRQWGRQQAIEMITTPLPVEAGGWHTLRALNKQVPGTFPRRCRNLASGNKSHSISHSLWPKGTNLLLPLVRTGSETGQGHIGCYDPAARHWGRTSLTLSPPHPSPDLSSVLILLVNSYPSQALRSWDSVCAL